MLRKLLFALLLLLPTAASADYQNLGQPYPITWNNAATLTVATGGTSQTVFVANSGRRALFIENPVSATEDLYIEFGLAASTTTTGGSIDIAPGANITMGIGVVSQQQINVNAATSAHAFIAKEGT